MTRNRHINLKAARPLACILLAVLLGACTKSPQPISGIAKWDDVQSNAEAFVLHGNMAALLSHCDSSGVPSDKLSQVMLALKGWHAASSNLMFTNTQVVTFDQYEALQQDLHTNLPQHMRDVVSSSVQWNVRPEKMILFTFVDPKDTTTKVIWSAGAYQTNGLWYFATAYTK